MATRRVVDLSKPLQDQGSTAEAVQAAAKLNTESQNYLVVEAREKINEAIEVLCIESLACQAIVRDRAELLIDRLGTLVDHSRAFALEVAERAVGYLFEPHLSFLLLFTEEYLNAQ